MNRQISIILPTYNRIDTLKECINSVLNQHYKHWELIIVDDSSTKDIENFLDVINDSRIRYHKNNGRKGLPGSRNVGISLSSYDLILFIEDDTVLDINMLSILVKTYTSLICKGINVGAIAPSRPWLFSEKGNISILDNYALRKKNEKLITPCTRGRFTGIVYSNFTQEFRELVEVPDVHACSLYSREAIDKVKGYDEKRYKGNFLYEETDLNYRIYENGYKFYFEPTAILYHIPTSEGGCRVDEIKYAYFFVVNHIKFVTKNFGLCSLYIVPFFLIFLIFFATKSFVMIAIKK